jgi:hypothetical protein
MPGLDWNDAQTFWLNVANVGLGVVTLLCFAALSYGLMRDWLNHRRRRAAVREMERGLRGDMAGVDSHAFHVPGLGLTMADGGELIDRPRQAPSKAPRRAKKPGA